jgi:hypothetical protein
MFLLNTLNESVNPIIYSLLVSAFFFGALKKIANRIATTRA